MTNSNQKIRNLKGFRDFLPSQMKVRNYVIGIFTKTFQQFGFEEIKTPTLEYASTLLGKYGPEADKLIYQFKDKGDRQIALRYDLTVPLAKFMTLYQSQIKLPFKRYQIQPVWRADKPQKGRYRQFTQADIDILGPQSPVNDAEIIAIIDNILQQLDFQDFSIHLNSRQVLFQFLDTIGIKKDKNTILQSLDKYQKIGQQGVTKELIDKGLNQSLISKLFDQIKNSKPDNYLQQVIDIAQQLGLNSSNYIFDPTMVRGLDYYTGPIFET
ncbi:histidine--tRNA ligase, partial [Candidatus Shapirobacteria bacterium]